MTPGMRELYDLVREIPVGRVQGYGALGRMLRNPVSGLVVGRWMAHCPLEAPWWRVVGADGSLKTYRVGPHVGLEQRELLIQEGVEFVGDQVHPSFFVHSEHG